MVNATKRRMVWGSVFVFVVICVVSAIFAGRAILRTGYADVDSEPEELPGLEVNPPHLYYVPGHECFRRRSDIESIYGRQCGVICLGYLLKSVGKDICYPDLLSCFHVGEQGVSVASICEVAGRHGIDLKGLEVDMKYLRNMADIPAILLCRNKKGGEHFVLYLGLDKDNKMVILDPFRILSSQGPQYWEQEMFSKTWDGVIIERDDQAPRQIRSR